MATEPRAAFVEALRGMLAACPCHAAVAILSITGRCDNGSVCACWPIGYHGGGNPCRDVVHALVRKAAEAFADRECLDDGSVCDYRFDRQAAEHIQHVAAMVAEVEEGTK